MAEFTFEILKFPGGIHSIAGSTITVLTKNEYARLTDKELRYRISAAAKDLHIEWQVVVEKEREPILKCMRQIRKWDKNKMNELDVATKEFMHFIDNMNPNADE